MMHSSIRILSLSLVVGLSVAAVSASAAEDLKQQIQNSSLDLSRAVELRNLTIELGGGVFDVDQGVLVPASPISGRVMEAVFVGKAQFHLSPPDEVEAQQLELFTQQATLEAEIQEAVFVVGNASIMDHLLHRSPATLDSATQALARKLFDGWVQGSERRVFGTDAAIWRAVSADPLYQEYFASEFHSMALGKFCLVLDPSESEQLMVGRFVPREIDDRQKRLSERALRMAQKRGRAIDWRLADLGDWDTWMRMSLRDEKGQATPGSTNFEPKHYDLEVRLDPKALTMEGKATLNLIAVRDGSRAVALDLFADLIPSSIRDGAGRELAWYRSGRDVHVMLADPVRKNESTTLEVNYSGVIFDNVGGEAFSLRDTGGWYPHAGATDRATYKLTLRWPKKYELMASGKVVESRLENKEQIETRVLEVPADEVSFEIGEFDVVEQQVGHVKMSVAFNRQGGTSTKEVEQEVVDTLKAALPFYEEKFGAYPLDYLTVVTIPREFSQGYLGFLTLADVLLYIRSPFAQGTGLENTSSRMRMETVAHELAHQWWGNLMGWKSYRDQWLSEALADYSAVLYLQSQSKRQSVYLAEHSKEWKQSLRQTTLDGRSLESLGPVVMGQRLNSSLSDRAYQAVVYGKGPLVFAMLGRAVGEDKLALMLKHLVKALSNQPIDTETFLASIEKMGSVNLSSFSKQFVYGTGIPEIYYTFQFKHSADGRWEVQGEARQGLLPHYDYRLVHKQAGWEIGRVRRNDSQVLDRTLLVPFQVILEDSGGVADNSKRNDYQTARGLGGTLKVSGPSTPFTFKIDKRPRDFWLDQRGEVLAYFFCSSREPKRALRYMAAEGPPEEGETMYKRALQAELLVGEALEDSGLTDRELKRASRLEDARTFFGLARWYLDQGRVDESRQALNSGEELIRASEGQFWQDERAALHSRHNLLRGEYKETYNRLNHELRMYFPVKAGEHASAGWRRAQWQEGRIGDGEEYAMLAVAAFETSHIEVAQLATKYAEERGADMTVLKQLLPPSKED
jgi:hypothetical protein